MIRLIGLLKNEGHPLKILLKRPRGLLNNEKQLYWNFSILCPSNDFEFSPASGVLV
jgi:hypothetical protein